MRMTIDCSAEWSSNWVSATGCIDERLVLFTCIRVPEHYSYSSCLCGMYLLSSHAVSSYSHIDENDSRWPAITLTLL